MLDKRKVAYIVSAKTIEYGCNILEELYTREVDLNMQLHQLYQAISTEEDKVNQLIDHYFFVEGSVPMRALDYTLNDKIIKWAIENELFSRNH